MEEENKEIRSETKFTPLGEVTEKRPKNKKGKKVLIILILLLLLLAIIAGGIYYYFAIYTNTQVIYKHIIKTGVDKYLVNPTEDITTVEANMKLDLDINLVDKNKQKSMQELIDIINNLDAELDIKLDVNTKKVDVELDSNYEGKELINVDMLMDAENKETYVKLEQFFNNVIKVDLDDEQYNDLLDSFDFEYMTLEKRIIQSKILNTELQNIIKEQYCSKEKEKITIDSKNVTADKYVLTMTLKELMQELKTTIENLKNNENYLNCFEDKKKQKQNLENILDELNKEELSNESKIYIKIYRAGFKQEFVRIDFEIEVEKQKAILKFEKSNDAYNFELNFDGKTYLTGNIKTEDLDDENKKISLTLNSEELGNVTFNIEYSYEFNEDIDYLKIDNSVDLQNITEGDLLQAYGKFLNSKLHELIEKINDISKQNLEFFPIPNINNNAGQNTKLEENISLKGEKSQDSSFIVFAKNGNDIPVDLEIEVEFYDAGGKILGSCSDDLIAVGSGRQIAIAMWNVPANFDNYEIYIDAEETEELEYFDKIDMTHNNTGEIIAVQVKNNSEDMIEFMTISVVYYKDGKIVGIADAIDSDIKPGRSGNFNLDYPYDDNYNNLEFDKYEVYINEAYSYSW